MSCYHPRPQFVVLDQLTGELFYSLWRPRAGASFNPVSQKYGLKIIKEQKVPCRQCIGCRSSDVLHWAIRMSNESLYYKESSFLTLTVSDDQMENVFPGRSLCYEPFQEFIRAFRKYLGFKIKFYMCGEYGDLLSRPHYHSIIFGWFPDSGDRVLYKTTSLGDLFISKRLARYWPFGFHTVARFSRDCASYVAGYINKKINGKLKPSYYGTLEPEFSVCSKGIGELYYHDFKRDIYNGRDGHTLPGGFVLSPGRYYDLKHQQYHPDHMESIKTVRSQPDSVRDFLNSPSQLKAREVVHRSKRKPGRNNFGGGL